jgi:geranylgeranyl pyrophosphate synthase
VVEAPLNEVILGIKIIDDIQDEEERCLAADVGVGEALNVARAAIARGIALIAALPFSGDARRAALAAMGRGIRDTAIGQELERDTAAGFDSYWTMVDRKTIPLVATALELGALAAGAEPQRAAALTRLALPMGRLLQVGDDCHDALNEQATDWRAPHLNLLMLYTLLGPHGDELAALLPRCADPSTLRAAQVLLLRDGALAYAMHAQTTTLRECASILDDLALPNPAPFLASIAHQREETESLLRQCGVDAEVAAALAL